MGLGSELSLSGQDALLLPLCWTVSRNGRVGVGGGGRKRERRSRGLSLSSTCSVNPWRAKLCAQSCGGPEAPLGLLQVSSLGLAVSITPPPPARKLDNQQVHITPPGLLEPDQELSCHLYPWELNSANKLAFASPVFKGPSDLQDIQKLWQLWPTRKSPPHALSFHDILITFYE